MNGIKYDDKGKQTINFLTFFYLFAIGRT